MLACTGAGLLGTVGGALCAAVSAQLICKARSPAPSAAPERQERTNFVMSMTRRVLRTCHQVDAQGGCALSGTHHRVRYLESREPALDYDDVAADYDRRYQLHAYPGIRQALLEVVGRGRREGNRVRVLELGCGTAKWLAELASSECDVAGIDPSAEMLRRASARVTGDLRLGDAESLPWSMDEFDVVACVNSLHHFASPADGAEGSSSRPSEGRLVRIDRARSPRRPR